MGNVFLYGKSGGGKGAEIKSYTINSSEKLSRNSYITLATLTLDKPLLAILGIRGIADDGTYFGNFTDFNFLAGTVAMLKSSDYQMNPYTESAINSSTYYPIAAMVYNKIATSDSYEDEENIIGTRANQVIYITISDDRKTIRFYGRTTSNYASYNQYVSSGKNTFYYITE